jgi:hypothetical protein
MAILTILRSLPIPTEIVPTERACSNNFSVGIGNRNWQMYCTYVAYVSLNLTLTRMNNAHPHVKKSLILFFNLAFNF